MRYALPIPHIPFCAQVQASSREERAKKIMKEVQVRPLSPSFEGAILFQPPWGKSLAVQYRGTVWFPKRVCFVHINDIF